MSAHLNVLITSLIVTHDVINVKNDNERARSLTSYRARELSGTPRAASLSGPKKLKAMSEKLPWHMG